MADERAKPASKGKAPRGRPKGSGKGKAPAAPTGDIPARISAPQAAILVGLESAKRITQLTDEGWITRVARGAYATRSVIAGYIAVLKGERRESTRSAAENRVRDARAREIEIRVAEREGELVEIAEAEAVVDEIATLLKSEMDGLGARITRDPDLKRKIDEAVNDVFERASARALQAVQALREGRDPLETESEGES